MSAGTRATEFTVTADHLKLLGRSFWQWEDCEFGAPSIDCKRPFGNSDVDTDIAEILGGDRPSWEAAQAVCKELVTVLTILTQHVGQPVEGCTFVRPDWYTNEWTRQEPQP